MTETNPFGEFRSQCEEVLRSAFNAFQEAVSEKLPEIDVASTIENPPNPELGQLASSISFELSRARKVKPIMIAKEIAGHIKTHANSLIESVETVEPGYINFRARNSSLSQLTLTAALERSGSYGLIKSREPGRIIVEHTSANPAHPIHIGTAKNAIFGDTLVRLLSAQGHEVQARFYIDDAGLQSATLAYGYKLLNQPAIREKPDNFTGRIYSITSTLVEIAEAKKRLAHVKSTKAPDLDIVAATKSLDDWIGVASELQSKFQDEFNTLSDLIGRDTDPGASVRELVRAYEKGDPEARRLGRKVCQLVLTGFEETLRRASIFFNDWDWESDVLWSGRVRELLDRLKETGFAINKAGSWQLDVERAVETYDLRKKLGVSTSFEIPSLILTRSDGTTLYTTRDIAYSLFKFEKADRVITVIGVEQSIAQLQLRVALWLLGHKREAQNYHHYKYGLVELEGERMSGRRGRYVTFDQVLDEAKSKARAEVDRRSGELLEDQKATVAERISVSAVRFTILSVEAAKSTNFVWNRALNFEANSAPFINYAYTRALSILKKIDRFQAPENYELLNEPVEKELVLSLSKFPDVFTKSANELDPTAICLYANELSQRFHEFYEKSDISHLADPDLKMQRAALVMAVKNVLRSIASLLGLQFAERM